MEEIFDATQPAGMCPDSGNEPPGATVDPLLSLCATRGPRQQPGRNVLVGWRVRRIKRRRRSGGRNVAAIRTWDHRTLRSVASELPPLAPGRIRIRSGLVALRNMTTARTIHAAAVFAIV